MVLFHKVIQVFPLCFDFDVRFIHPPPAAHGAFMTAKCCIQQGGEAAKNPGVLEKTQNVSNSPTGMNRIEAVKNSQAALITQGNVVNKVLLENIIKRLEDDINSGMWKNPTYSIFYSSLDLDMMPALVNLQITKIACVRYYLSCG